MADEPQSLEGLTPDEAQQYISPPAPAQDTPDSLEGMTPDEAAPHLQTQQAAPQSLEGLTPDAAKQYMAANPETESGDIGSTLRSTARSILPTVGALEPMGAGAAAGAEIGTLTSPITGPVGPIVGGLIGGAAGALGAGYLISKAQDWVADHLGLSTLKSDVNPFNKEQEQADVEQHPYLTTAGSVIAGGAAFEAGAATKLARLGTAGIFGGLEAGQEYAQEGKVDPGKVLVAGVGGAFLAKPRAWAEARINSGANAARYMAGRPDVKPTQQSLDEKADVDQNDITTTASGIAADNPPVNTNVTNVGNAEKGPGVTDGQPDYRKSATPAGQDQITQPSTPLSTADIHEDIAAALGAKQPQPAETTPPIQTGLVEAAAPAQEPTTPISATLPTIAAQHAQDVYRVTNDADALAAVRAKATAGQQGEAFEPAEGETDNATLPANATPTEYTKAPDSPTYPHPDPDLGGLTIDRTQKLPQLSHISTDGKTVNIDPSVPTSITIRGKQLNPDIPLSIREAVARQASDRIIDMTEASGSKRPDPATLHNTAAEAGTNAMNEWLVNNGYDTAGFKSQMDKVLAGRNEGATAKVPKVVSDTLIKARAAGRQDIVDLISKAPPEQRVAIAAKSARSLANKTGTVAADYAATRIPSKAPEVEGLGVTARSKADQARKQGALSAITSAFDTFKPESQVIPTSAGDIEALRTRLSDAVEHAKAQNGGADPLAAYKPRVKPAAYQWLRSAAQLVKGKMTPKQIANFMATESNLRSGTGEAAANEQNIARTEADIARQQRPNAETANAAQGAENTAAIHRTDFSPLPEWKPGSDLAKPEIDASNELRNWINKLSDEDYQRLVNEHPDIRHDVELTQDPEELLRNYSDVLNEAPAKPIAEPTVPKPVPLKRIAGKPIGEAEGAASAGKSLMGTPKFDRIKAEAEARMNAQVAREKQPGYEPPRREINEPDKIFSDTSGEAAESTIKKFLGNEAGSGILPEALQREPSGRFSAAKLTDKSALEAAAISDDLHTMDQKDTTVDVDMLNRAKETPKEFQDPAVQEKIYLARESGNLDMLTPAERKYYDTDLKSVLDETGRMYEALKALDPRQKEGASLTHISRRVAGKSEIDPRDPIAGQRAGVKRSLNTTTAPLMERTYKVIESPTGQRAVISPTDNGVAVWKGGTRTMYPVEDFDFTTGSKVDLGGKEYTVKEAMTPEIERNARNDEGDFMSYHKNAAYSAYMAYSQIHSALQHLAYLNKLTGSVEFKANATKSKKVADANGWQASVLPQFKDWYMNDEYRHVFDDYAQPGFAGNASLDWARNLSRQVTKLMFWLPSPHILNVGAHWFVSRDWKWLSPVGYKDLVTTGLDSIRSVVSQDEFQNQMRAAGAGTLSGGVMTQDLARKIGRAVGMDIQRNPTAWDPIVKSLGLDNARALADAIYKGSSRIMWAANDMFLTQAVKENMARGMTMQDAIVKAERHIPNYRVPTKIMTQGNAGRMMSQFLQDPLFSAFGRYRYGVFNSYAHIVKGLVNGTGEQRIESIGNLMAMGMLAFGIYPVLSKMAQVVTGNKEAEQRPRGPLAIPTHYLKVLQGKEDLGTANKATLTIPPLVSTLWEAMNNQDWAGRKIVEPGTIAGVSRGHVPSMVRAVAQEGEHAVRGLVSPYGTVANAIGRKQSVGDAVRDALLDQKNPSARSIRFERQENKRNQQADRRRFNKPVGPFEAIVNKFTGR